MKPHKWIWRGTSHRRPSWETRKRLPGIRFVQIEATPTSSHSLPTSRPLCHILSNSPLLAVQTLQGSCALARDSRIQPASPHPRRRLLQTSSPSPSLRTVVARAAPRRDNAPAPPSTCGFLALKREHEEEEEEEVSVEPRGGGGGDVFSSEDDANGEAKRSGGGESSGRRKRRQMARRSGLLAKQVISVSSARSLGFVSQLWFYAASWIVALVEVRPSLLSGEAEKFLFEDIYQVGDVVLVEDETVVENEFKLVGLHSLVGYNVVTSRRRNVGKVNLCSLYERCVASTLTSTLVLWSLLSLTHLGFLLSLLVWQFAWKASCHVTYKHAESYVAFSEYAASFFPDAISRVQRLTQGILGTQNIQGPGGQMDENGRYRRRKARPVQRQNSLRKSSGRKLHRKMRDRDDDWELPMDY